MRLSPSGLAIIALISSISAQASNNIIRTPALITVSNGDSRFWQQIDDYVTDWQNVRSEYACSPWAPEPSTQTIGVAFLQTQFCNQDQERAIQRREKNLKTEAIRNVGNAQVEHRTQNPSNTRQAVGALESWIATSPTFTDWESVSGALGCTNWSPNPSDYTQSATVNQKATNCVVDQARTRQEREQETTTGDIRNSGSTVAESRQLTGQTATRPYVITIGDWASQGEKTSCSNWAPATTTVGLGKAFTQTATDCQQAQTRARTEQYTDHLSGQKVTALNTTEKQTITVSDTRDSVGTLEDWIAASSTYTDWSTVKGPYGCGNWTPSGSTYTSSASFTQSSSTCALDQFRSRQDREQESNTGTYRDKGAVVAENRTLSNQSATRPYQVVLGAWANNGAVTSCSNWTPDPSTVTVGASFTQTATNCAQPQTRTRVEQYTDNETGKAVTLVNTSESRSITASSTRTLTGTKETWAATTPTYTAWANSGAATSCSNWSPDPSTVAVGQSFTQTASDCDQVQARSRQDREQETTTKAIRNKGAAVAETQTIKASSTRISTGSKETWAATTSTYTSWTNIGSVSSCSNWSPATSTVTVGSAFTQTATDCDQLQTRTRQDREKETTTGAIRNKGSVVTETQTVKASTTRSATGTKETWVATTSTYTAWANSGTVSSCSNWSPATSTVTVGQAFTQTATDCDQVQTRTRQDREQETTTGAIRNKGSAVSEMQTIKASSTRNAVGTKETWIATTPTYSNWVNSGAATSCSNWSPAISTVKTGQSFTQTATDCTQGQTRTRQDREQETTTKAIRNKGSAVTERQTIASSSTRAAVGGVECFYDGGTYVLKSGDRSRFYWEGVQIGSTIASSLTTGGYTYSSGDFVVSINYQICRAFN